MNWYEEDLENAKKSIRENAYFMNNSIQSNDIRNTLKYSNLMLCSLKIENLSPRSYNDLFFMVFDQLNNLENAFRELSSKNKKKIVDIYEKTQHAVSIIPRLYLMITAGSVLIESMQVEILEVLNDIFSMMKGVQHPFKGLFLRYYFMKTMKKRIEDQEENININDFLDIYLQNLTEMNKLWIRINSLIQDNNKRRQERNQLKNLIGENIYRIANLENISLELYKEVILNKLVTIITSHKDRISQEYLMICTISAFQDNFIIETLDEILKSTEKLSPKINLNLIYIELMNRLSEFAKNNQDNRIKNNISIYNSFKSTISNIFNQKENYKLKNLLELARVFLNFVVLFYNGKVEWIEEILILTNDLCVSYKNEDFEEKEVLKNLVDILTIPLEKLSLKILNIENFPKLLKYLPQNERKIVGKNICESIIKSYTYLVNEEIIDKLFNFIEPFFTSNEKEELVLIGKLINVCDHHKPSVLYKMINKFKDKFSQENKLFLKYIFKFIAYKYFYLLQKNNSIIYYYNENNSSENFNEEIKKRFSKNHTAIYLINEDEDYSLNIEEDCKLNINEIWEFIRSSTSKLEDQKPITSFKIWLEFMSIVDKYEIKENKDLLIEEITIHIFDIFEFNISKSSDKIYYFNILCGYIFELSNIEYNLYNDLLFMMKNLIGLINKREDQTKLLIKLSVLYSHSKYENIKSLEDILKRTLKTAHFSSNINKNNTILFVQILEIVIYYINKKITNMSISEVNTIINIIEGNLKSIESENIKKEINKYFDRVKNHLEESKIANPELYKENN